MKDMKRDIASLFDEMSHSWLFIGGGAETAQPEVDPIEEGDEKWNFMDPLLDDSN